MADHVDDAVERLLEFLRDERGFDFTGYKRASLTRRIRKRMQEVGVEDVDVYHDHLQAHPEEFTHLFNTILINVTRFFRDPESWEFLAREVVQKLVGRKGARGEIRIWSVGVASGEEAYTLAMLLAEAVGLEQLRTRVKVYATDVDEHALADARSATYAAEAVEAIPEALRTRYLVESAAGFTFRKELRRAVVFGRHDLLNDAPISRVDLIVCRNTLIYFNRDTQSRIFESFQFALRPDGFLFLGQAERFAARSDRFSPLDPKERVYARLARDGEVERASRELGRAGQAAAERLRGAVFDSATTAQIVIDAAGRVVAVNGLARELFDLSESDVGRVFYELQVSYKPVELRSRIDRALSSRRPMVELDVPWTTSGGQRHHLQIEAVPLFMGGDSLGVTIAFIDVTDPYETSSQLERARRELETAYEEIQSTVEELETTNEELQSTNEELATINSELNDRTAQLSRSNSFRESIVESLRAGVIVLDHELAVVGWNSMSEELWGLRDDEVRGTNVFALDIGLPVAELRDAIRACVNGETEHTEATVDAVNRRGQPVRCEVTCSTMKDGQSDRHGVMLFVEPT